MSFLQRIKCKHCGSNLNVEEKVLITNENNKNLENLLRVAKTQKGVIWCVLFEIILWTIYLIYIGKNQQNEVPEFFASLFLLFLLILVCFQIVYVYRLATALKMAIPVLWTIGSLFILLGIFVLIFLSGQATKNLREAGFKVGLLGANIQQIQNEFEQKRLI
jgi:hypothetical protein